MKIGQFAISVGTNASTVRYYEQIGLLPPPKRIRGGQKLWRGGCGAARVHPALPCARVLIGANTSICEDR